MCYRQEYRDDQCKFAQEFSGLIYSDQNRDVSIWAISLVHNEIKVSVLIHVEEIFSYLLEKQSAYKQTKYETCMVEYRGKVDSMNHKSTFIYIH